MKTFLPFLISFAIGFLIVELLLKNSKTSSGWKLLLGCGLGLGISSHLAFYGFLIYDKLCPELTINSHLLLLAGLLGYIFYTQRNKKPALSGPASLPWQTGIILLSFLAALALVVKMAFVYPKGGWDAWQVWNFKAKFLYLAGDNWQNLFDPQLWRTSPHYPLLLPLINVWAWLVAGKYLEIIPLMTSVIFTTLTAGVIAAALWHRTKNYFSALAGLLLLTLPFFNLLAISQYCDIALSFYLLATLITLGEALTKERNYHSLLAGLFTGFLGFTKPEGLVAALLVCSVVIAAWLLSKLRNPKIFSTENCGLFLLGLTLASIPTFAFHVLYSPGNQTFINGFASADKPSNFERFQAIMAFLFTELKHAKWGGLWFLVLGGIILGGKNAWTGKNLLPGLFFLLYLGVILAYYQVNTYFEIKWWLSVSLNRILFSLLPLALYWAFSSALAKK